VFTFFNQFVLRFKRSLSDIRLALPLVANSGAERVGRIFRHDPLDPGQHHHRGQDEATSGQANEGERSKSENDERDFAGNQGTYNIVISLTMCQV